MKKLNAKTKSYTDQLGNIYFFEKTPIRIVSLVPSLTELLVDMGLEENLIGITKFCVHPNHLLKSKTKIGGTKKVDCEKIILLKPDIIIANKEENTLEIVEELSNICPVWVTDIVTIDESLKMIQDFGEIFEKQTEAQNWVEKIKVAQNDFKIFIQNKTILKVAYLIWANPYMVAGKETFIHQLLILNKFQNSFENQNRYPEIELQDLKNADLILLSSEPFPFNEKHVKEIQKFAIKSKIILVDGEMFSWYGSRLFKAFEYFKKLHA